MRKITLFLATIILLMVSCGEKNAYTIAGVVIGDEYEGETVYLYALDTVNWENRQIVDSTYIKDGKFEFAGLAEVKPALNFVLFNRDADSVIEIPVVIEPGNIEIVFDKTNLDKSALKGTLMNEKLFNTLVKVGEKEQPDSQVLYEELVKNNMDNQVGVFLFAKMAKELSFEQKKEAFAAMAPEFKDNEQVKKIERRFNRELAAHETAVGSNFVDVKGKTPDGAEVALSDYAGKGKYVLVDFWASWCPPCRAEMPKLVKLYSKYKSKGLEIVGISLDKENQAWKDGIKKLNITWPQMSDLKHWDSELSAPYGISGIPHLMLIDKEGKIIGRDLGADEVEAKLVELLK